MNTVLNFDFATFQFAFCVRIRLEFGGGGLAYWGCQVRHELASLGQRLASSQPVPDRRLRVHQASFDIRSYNPQNSQLSPSSSPDVYQSCYLPSSPQQDPLLLISIFLSRTVTYRYVLQLEMHVRFICAIKFYPLTYLLLAAALPVHLMSFFVSLGLWFC